VPSSLPYGAASCCWWHARRHFLALEIPFCFRLEIDWLAKVPCAAMDSAEAPCQQDRPHQSVNLIPNGTKRGLFLVKLIAPKSPALMCVSRAWCDREAKLRVIKKIEKLCPKFKSMFFKSAEKYLR
jgi:hypothetical protein